MSDQDNGLNLKELSGTDLWYLAKNRHHRAVQYDCSDYPVNSKLKRLWLEFEEAESALLERLQ